MQCPNCQSDADNRVIWGPRSLLAVLANAVQLFVAASVWPFPPLFNLHPLRRKCYKCGYKFLGERPEPPDFDTFAKCEYNLTGNTSGRCPECGWKLPRRYRARRREADREGSTR